MKKTALVFLILLLGFSLVNAQPQQPPDTLWTRTLGGNSNDYGFCVKQTLDGGYIVAGYTDSYGVGSNDFYLIKTDSMGNQEWSNTFGGGNTDKGYSVQQTTDGGYIIAGYTQSFGAGGYDVYLVKTDVSGNQQWHQAIGGSANDYAFSVGQTSDGGYIIAGYTCSYGAGNTDVYLVKTDASGIQQWYRTFGGIANDCGRSVQQTSDGGYIIAGYTFSYGAGNYDIYLVKTDSFGNQQWYRTFGGNNYDVGFSVDQTSEGGYIIVGNTESYGAGYYDIYLVKTDAGGNQQWYRTFGGSSFDEGFSVEQTADSGYIITGYTMSYGAGNHDIYLLKADDMGNQQWFKTFGGSGLDVGFSGQQAADGGYIITGYTSSYGAGYYDIYLIKTEDETGELILALLPVNPPIIIPAGGGSFNFVADITNLNNTPTVFDAWTEVSIPGITDPRSLLLREGQMILGYENMTSLLTQYVGASAPAGIYTYRGFVGIYPDYITACDSFTFEKAGVTEGFDKSQSWAISGWGNEIDYSCLTNFGLLSVSPNPFNEKTVISFEFRDASQMELAVFDIQGRKVQSLVNGHRSSGKHSVVWDAKGMASGVYFVRLKAGDFNQVQKMVLMK